jgi:hypothetical protein
MTLSEPKLLEPTLSEIEFRRRDLKCAIVGAEKSAPVGFHVLVHVHFCCTDNHNYNTLVSTPPHSGNSALHGGGLKQ